MPVLEPNSVEAIKWGLQNYDGVEFDVRISKDDVPVIHHDTYIHGTFKRIQDMDLEELREHNIGPLEELLNDPDIVQLCNEENKFLWLELKPDCKIFNRIMSDEHVKRMYNLIDEIITKGGVKTDQFNVFTFAIPLLKPFIDDEKYRAYGIIPDIDECDTRSGLIRKIISLPKFFRRSVIYHGHRFKEAGMDGILFPHEYVKGFRSWFHPSLEKVIEELRTPEFHLVTQTANLEEEEEYPTLIRFTDHADPKDCPRTTNNFDNHIVIHRGCGTNPLTVP